MIKMFILVLLVILKVCYLKCHDVITFNNITGGKKAKIIEIKSENRKLFWEEKANYFCSLTFNYHDLNSVSVIQGSIFFFLCDFWIVY